MSGEAYRKKGIRHAIAGAILTASMVFGLICMTAPSARAASWMDYYLDKVVEWGVMRGDIDGNLDPERSITRAEFVTMVNRAYGYTDVGPNPFSDVSSKDWFYEDICIAYKGGYFAGTSSTTASPRDPLTREQAAMIIGRNMMLQEGTGEALGFTDSREFSDWSRHMVQAVAEEGVVSGYADGSFGPQDNVTRGQVAAMLVQAIGTPVNESGVHSLGGVYGNLTITSPGVTLKDTTVYGNLFISGGVGLSDVELDNVKVLGRVVVSGTGESEEGEHSVLLRNVTADELVLDSITNQFVTLKADGLTDIGEVNVRTEAYLEDITSDGLGLANIKLDGERGAEFLLAGNIKNVVNLTPSSVFTLAQGVAKTITVDEKAIGTTLNINNKAVAETVNLDTATDVMGTGDISHMNVNAAGSSSVMLPDTITVRPGITADIYGETMDAVAAQESSEDPRLLAGYPKAKNVAPKTADIVFKTNKKGTIYWALTALADGTVQEEDLIDPPEYSGKIISSGTLSATASNTEFTAKLSGLTTDGSYYVSAILVDNRDMRSPVKITAFTTPDDTTPAFVSGYPTASIADGVEDEQIIQTLVMPNKDCRMYYALLSKGSTAPKPADFKANAVSGNLGYGTVDLQKNTPYLVSRVNTAYLQEETDYDLYLWLTDVDGSKSSAVKKLTVKTLDRTPPKIQHLTVKDVASNSVTLSYALDEPGTFYWAVVKQGAKFRVDESLDPGSKEAMAQIESGINALKKGSSTASKAQTDVKFTISGLEPQTAYDVYYMAKDKAGNYCIYDTSTIKLPYSIYTLDSEGPTVEQKFTHDGSSGADLTPYPDTSIRLVFSENVQGLQDRNEDGDLDEEEFLELYQNYKDNKITADEMAAVLRDYIRLYEMNETEPVKERTSKNEDADDWVIDYRKVKIEMDKSGTGELLVIFPYNKDPGLSALNLAGGVTYQFKLEGIADTSTAANRMAGENGITTLPEFTTISAQIMLTETYDQVPEEHDGKAEDGSVDRSEEKWNFDMVFSAKPVSHESMAADILWDLIVWSDSSVKFKVYMKEMNKDGETWGEWSQIGGEAAINTTDGQMLGVSVGTALGGKQFEPISAMRERIYGIEITATSTGDTRENWNTPVTLRLTTVSGRMGALENAGDYLSSSNNYDMVIGQNANVTDITVPLVFTLTKPFVDSTDPKFSKGFPSLVAGDTSVNIRVATDRPNSTFYYVIALVGDIVTKRGNDDVVWADLPKGWVEEKDMCLVDSPTSDTVMNYKSSGPEDTIKSGKGRYVSSVPTVKVTGLQPKTEYIAYFVLQGEAQASYSPKVYCFGFKTGDVQTPIITLSDYSPEVMVRTSTDAEVDWVLMESTKAVSHNVLKQPFRSLIGPNDYDESSIADKQAQFDKDYKKLFPVTMFPYETGNDATVLDALRATMPDDDNDGVSMSVFDYYANTAIYQEVLNFVQNSQSGTQVTSQGSLETLLNDPEYVLPKGMSVPIRYHFIAVAKNAMGTRYGFSAISGIHAEDSNPPELLSCDTYISAAYKSGQPVDISTTLASPVGYTFRGTVTLAFDKALYYVSREQDSAPKALNDIKDKLKDYIAFTGINIESVTLNGYSITISFSGASLTSGITIFNSGTISDEYGNTENKYLRLTVESGNGTVTGRPVVFKASWASYDLS